MCGTVVYYVYLCGIIRDTLYICIFLLVRINCYEKPILIPAVVTHFGELGRDTISLVERLTSVAGKQFCVRNPHTRGITKARVTAAFRSRFKDALLAANARGFGEALIATGNPIAGWALMMRACRGVM